MANTCHYQINRPTSVPLHINQSFIHAYIHPYVVHRRTYVHGRYACIQIGKTKIRTCVIMCKVRVCNTCLIISVCRRPLPASVKAVDRFI